MAQYFTGKIFKTLGLWVTAMPGYFSGESCKILDLQELLTRARFYWLQNIDFAGLARKILQNIDLAQLVVTLIGDSLPIGRHVPRFLWTENPKILISNNLDGADPDWPLQNLERVRLTRKILRNKDLGLYPLTLA